MPALLLSACLVLVPQNTAAESPSPYDPTDRYEPRQIEGWRVLVHRDFLAQQPALADETLKLLAFQLYQIARRVPPGPLAKLRKITIWVEAAEPHHRCMAYHPSAEWLRAHGMNPDKAKCVEIANARNFLDWTLDQPWMVLHELAHGYHDQFLGGYGNPELRAAYDRAMQAKRYEAVMRVCGKVKRAYAATNPMEYFAETSEAFFGVNDYYPFVRGELRAHDPEMESLLAKLWETGSSKPQ